MLGVAEGFLWFDAHASIAFRRRMRGKTVLMSMMLSAGLLSFAAMAMRVTAMPLVHDRYIPKGGVGIVADGLYISTSSQVNTLFLQDGKQWRGKRASVVEVVHVEAGRVESVDPRSPLAAHEHGVSIAFERNRIYFYDYGRHEGGYYPRR